MECRCTEMEKLTKQMEKLSQILNKSDRFCDYNEKAIEKLQDAKKNAYDATKSTCVQNDVSVMPEMTDLIEDSHSTVVKAIEDALIAMEEKYWEYEEEDNSYHAQEN